MIGIFKYYAWGRGVPEIKTKTGSWQMPRRRFLNQSKALLYGRVVSSLIRLPLRCTLSDCLVGVGKEAHIWNTGGGGLCDLQSL